MIKPTFTNVALRIEKAKKDVFTDVKEIRIEATLIAYGKECDHDDIQRNLDKKVLFNGRLILTVEDTEEYYIVIADQQSVVAIV